MKKTLCIVALSIFSLALKSQPVFNMQDTLRGSLNEHRDWFDIQHYDITVKPTFETKSIIGQVSWTSKVVKPTNNIQIDLQQPLIIDSVIYFAPNTKTGNPLSFSRNGNIAIANFNEKLNVNTNFKIVIYYHGIPVEAVRPPWDGGWIWKKDANGKPWMSAACQGLGASIWYPCKDHQSDEPDQGASLTMIVPDTLMAIGNGRMIKKESNNQLATYTWEVKNPINNYNIIPYIGDYMGWSEKYSGLKGNLDLHYWVLKQDSTKAKAQFTQVPQMLKAFEYWLGPYPFYEDGYQLVQSPHLGMEHQSAVAYGNKFANGYLGRDLSGTGWGLKWDFIIVHESGHEWFANNITTNDIADMWVHEGFTMYSEVLFIEYHYGKKAADAYCQGIRTKIRNDRPIIGFYGVNHEGSGDMYNKGAGMLHHIRTMINNDSLFREILLGLNKEFYHKTVDTKDIEDYFIRKTSLPLSPVFNQYLRATKIPIFEYTYNQGKLRYRFTNCDKDFTMPVRLDDKESTQIVCNTTWNQIELAEITAIESISENYYFTKKKVE